MRIYITYLRVCCVLKRQEHPTLESRCRGPVSRREFAHCESEPDAHRVTRSKDNDVGEEECHRRARRHKLDAHAERNHVLVRGDGGKEGPHSRRVLLQADGNTLESRLAIPSIML